LAKFPGYFSLFYGFEPIFEHSCAHQGLQRIPEETAVAAAAECIPPELLQPGRSVYDDDDFDINTRDAVDLSRVHRGKKNKGGDAKKLLDDKRDLGKNRFQMLDDKRDLGKIRFRTFGLFLWQRLGSS
jgi:hypothetical protein